MIYNYEKNKDNNIPVRIRQEREISGLTQDLLSEKIGLSRQTLINYESGRSPVPIDVILKMCEVFGCEAEYLLCASDQRNRVTTDICKITGLSESAVNHIIALNQEPKRLFNDGSYNAKPKILSKILENDNFKDLIDSVFDYCYTKSNDSSKDEDFKLFRLQNNFIRIVEKIKNSK